MKIYMSYDIHSSALTMKHFILLKSETQEYLYVSILKFWIFPVCVSIRTGATQFLFLGL